MQTFDVSQLTADGIAGVFLFLVVGIIMTVLTQSSSASIALTITAVSTGMVGIYAAGAMVIGANIGTTSTVLIASIGATSHAKRVAAAQVIFNMATALVALVILPILFLLIDGISKVFNLDTDPAISLALFHTVFNLLGVLLVYPHNDRLASFLEKRFCTPEEKASHPRFLDSSIAQTPELAVNALTLEMLSIADKVIILYTKAIHSASFKLKIFDNNAKAIKSLSAKVSKFIVTIESSDLAEKTTTNLVTLMRIDQYFLSCVLSVEHLAHQWHPREKLEELSLEMDTHNYFEHVLAFMKASRSNNFASTDFSNEKFVELQVEHDKIKANLILEATRSHISVVQMSATIDALAEALHIAQQWSKAFSWLHHLRAELESPSDASLDPIVNN